MPRFAANLTMLYPELPFLERFGAAARDGFKGVEYMFPYDFPATQLRSLLDEHGLSQVLFNAAAGDWAGGERGLASHPDRRDDFQRSIDQALDYARVLGNHKIHVMAGLLRSEYSAEQQRATYLDNLAWAAAQAQRDNITLVIEPINTRDMPGYFLNYQHQAQTICAELALTNVQVLFDIYHCQIMEGDLCTKLRRDLQRGTVGHIQIAGVPERHEPDQHNEVYFPHLFELIDQLGYDGWIGCEYRPRNSTSAGLTWLQSWLLPAE